MTAAETREADNPAVPPTAVWSAYHALCRYVRRAGTVGGLMPRQPSRRPRRRARSACTQIARPLSRYWESMPLSVSPTYYAYLYLFVQLLRVSFPKGPTLVDHVWVNLVWFPLDVLKGRGTNAERAWKSWWRRHTSGGSAPTESQLAVHYPWIDPVPHAHVIAGQVQLLLEIAQRGRLSPGEALAAFDLLGERMGPSSPAWHSALVAARPESWQPLSDGQALVSRRVNSLAMRVVI